MVRGFSAGLVAAGAVLALAGCAAVAPQKTDDEKITLSQTSFVNIPGWEKDDMTDFLTALRRSCARISLKDPAASFGPQPFAGTYADWQAVCKTTPSNDSAVKTWIESSFTPYVLQGEDGREGLFTGYYEPSLSEAAGGTPLYARPDDLVTVNLGDFREGLKGETVAGRVEGGRLVPYHTREEIEKGALEKKAQVLSRVDDPVDAFFLHIQGSGQVKKPDGTVQHVGYDSQNGHVYYAIGQELIKRGVLEKESVSMQSIRDWLEKNPGQAREIMNLNKSYVFFRALNGDGPLGAEGVALTPARSMAVDRKKIPYGAPVFIDIEPPGASLDNSTGNAADVRIRRLMVAQDTGGAITGAVRGDFFWGAGDAAARDAGVMKSRGYAYILLPKTVVVPPSFAGGKSESLGFWD